jgi:predicted PP-loop superfamily ATPase
LASLWSLASAKPDQAAMPFGMALREVPSNKKASFGLLFCCWMYRQHAKQQGGNLFRQRCVQKLRARALEKDVGKLKRRELVMGWRNLATR